MGDQPSAGGPRRPGIFLSYAHRDAGFARRLGRDLASAGVRVWIDEGEMGIGDSLLEKIRAAISEMDYLGVVISPHSARSDWVTREIDMAMSEDVAGQKVKVLPLLLRDGEPPSSLQGKLFADFRTEPAYAGSLQSVLDRLGVNRASSGEKPDRLTELASSSALFASALKELCNNGLSVATSAALVLSDISDVEFSEFLTLAAREVGGEALFGLALSLVQYIDERQVGQEALSFCLTGGRLEPWQMTAVAGHMTNVKSEPAVMWCHSQLTSLIKSDDHYHTFLLRHVDLVASRDFDTMAAYLLHPNRGPSHYNLDSFALVISHVPNPSPFTHRCIEWINDGYFDGIQKEGSEPASTLYDLLNDHWDYPKFDVINQAIQSHVHLLMKSRLPDYRKPGLYHLVAMIDTRYHGSENVLTNTLERWFDFDVKERQLLELSKSALRAVAASYREPSERANALVKELLQRVADADETGITGYRET